MAKFIASVFPENVRQMLEWGDSERLFHKGERISAWPGLEKMRKREAKLRREVEEGTTTPQDDQPGANHD